MIEFLLSPLATWLGVSIPILLIIIVIVLLIILIIRS